MLLCLHLYTKSPHLKIWNFSWPSSLSRSNFSLCLHLWVCGSAPRRAHVYEPFGCFVWLLYKQIGFRNTVCVVLSAENHLFHQWKHNPCAWQAGSMAFFACHRRGMAESTEAWRQVQWVFSCEIISAVSPRQRKTECSHRASFLHVGKTPWASQSSIFQCRSTAGISFTQPTTIFAVPLLVYLQWPQHSCALPSPTWTFSKCCQKVPAATFPAEGKGSMRH